MPNFSRLFVSLSEECKTQKRVFGLQIQFIFWYNSSKVSNKLPKSFIWVILIPLTNYLTVSLPFRRFEIFYSRGVVKRSPKLILVLNLCKRWPSWLRITKWSWGIPFSLGEGSYILSQKRSNLLLHKGQIQEPNQMCKWYSRAKGSKGGSLDIARAYIYMYN